MKIDMKKQSEIRKALDRTSLENSIILLNEYIPEIAWLVSLIEEGNGFLKLPSPHEKLLCANGIESWVNLYENSTNIQSVSLYLLLGNNKAIELLNALQHCTPEEIKARLDILKSELIKEGLDEASKNFGPSRLEISDLWSSVQRGDFSPAVINTYKSYLLAMNVFLAIGHNCLSLMRFGVTIFNLVKQAKQGNDKSLLKAITIDKSLLTSLDYFQSRLKLAHLSGDAHFLDGISKALRTPVIGEKIQYSNLMIAFAMLDDEGILDMPLKQLMYICEKVGVYGQDSEAHSEESLRQCRKRYRDKAVAKFNT